MAFACQRNTEAATRNLHNHPCHARHSLGGSERKVIVLMGSRILHQYYYGEEQNFYLYDSDNSNYLYG
jgi:hypothetical protein